jgi:hypothetical protein
MRSCLFVLFLLPYLFANSQANYQKGYVVTSGGDTLKGLIDYREWHQNPSKISFKTTAEDAQVRTFDAETARSFSLPGYEAYTSYTVSISMNETKFGYLGETADTSTTTKTVFLKELAKGDKLNLYAYKDKVKERFFVLDKRQDRPRELELRKTLKDMQENTLHLYRQQLQSIAISNAVLTPKLEGQIQSSLYTENDLQKIIRAINAVNEQGTSRMMDKKKRTAFVVSAGVYRNAMQYTGKNKVTVDGLDENGFDKYKSKVTTTHYLPRVTAGMDFYFNPVIRRVVIRTEVAFAPVRSSATSYYKFSNYSSQALDYRYNLKGWTVSALPQLLLNVYNTANLKAYLGAGGGFVYLHAGENSMLKHAHNQPDTDVQVTNDYFPIREFNLQVVVRAGVQLQQKFDISVIGGNPVEITNYISGNASIRSGMLALSVGYKF